MRFLKRMIRGWLEEEGKLGAVMPMPQTQAGLNSNAIRFGVFKANGGIVVEVYNPRIPQDEPELHVIREEEDIGNRLNSILVLESLK